MFRRADAGWSAYSLATGFLADAAALGLSAALSEDVSATVGGIFVAATVLEVIPLASDRAFKRSVARMRAASTLEEEGVNALASAAALVFGGIWIVAGVSVADWLVPNFDISGFWAYVGTVALVFAANLAIYLPLYLFRRSRRVA